MSFQNLEQVDAQPYRYSPDGVPLLAFSNNQIEAHAYRRRSTMPPMLDPDLDPTINQVIQARETWISDMVQAMFNIHGIMDNIDLPPGRMFTYGSDTAATGYEVEATCRVMFDMLIDRCRFGFRGAAKDNMALKPKQDCKEDRDGNCLSRITNVTNVLRISKCLCRDVLYEDYNCLKLINAPLQYRGRKAKTQRGNASRIEGRKQAKEAKTALGAVKENPAQKNMPAPPKETPSQENDPKTPFDLDMENEMENILHNDSLREMETSTSTGCPTFDFDLYDEFTNSCQAEVAWDDGKIHDTSNLPNFQTFGQHEFPIAVGIPSQDLRTLGQQEWSGQSSTTNCSPAVLESPFQETPSYSRGSKSTPESHTSAWNMPAFGNNMHREFYSPDLNIPHHAQEDTFYLPPATFNDFGDVTPNFPTGDQPALDSTSQRTGTKRQRSYEADLQKGVDEPLTKQRYP